MDKETDPDQKPNFHQIQKEFQDYWTPFNLVNGKYINQDGKWIKAAGWKQFKRWEWHMESRVNNTTGEFPTTSTDIEWEKYKASLPNFKSTASTANWENLGTSTSTSGYAGIGRINCIAFHPSDLNTYWVGTPAGGLWGTTDNGGTWTPMTDNENVIGVSNIIIPSDFATSNTIYIGMGDRDAWDTRSTGVLKSTDGGVTWNTTGLSFTVADYKMVYKILLDPNDDNHLIASTSYGVYETTNAAADWTLINSSTDILIDLEAKPGDFSTLYGSSKYGDVYKSTNGGSTWTIELSTDEKRTMLAISANDPTRVYAIVTNADNGLAAVYKSTDSGDSYSVVLDGATLNPMGYDYEGAETGGQAFYDIAFESSPADANVLFIGGINTWRSINGGSNWTIVSHWWGDRTAAVHADKHELIYRSNGDLFEGNDGGIYISTDNGGTWTDKTNGIVHSQIYRLGVSQTESGTIITGLQDNGSKLLDNGTWKDVKGGDGMECIIDYTNANIQYGTYTRGQITRTTDRWVSDETDINENIGTGDLQGAWVAPYIIDPTDHNTLYVGYADVWKTTDQGDNFTKISTMNSYDKLRSMAVAPSNTQYLYVADLSTIWVTNNGGGSWTDITGTLPIGSNSITYIAVDYQNPEKLWVTMGGYDGQRIFESTDAGTTWTNISTGLPQIPTLCVVQNTQATVNQLYVGTDVGVYVMNEGETWTLYNTGLPNVVVNELEIYYDAVTPANSRLVAATYGRGLWQTELAVSTSYNVDASISEISVPEEKAYCSMANITPTVKVQNKGIFTLTSFVVSYTIDGGTAVTQNWSGSLATNEIASITFAAIDLTEGDHNFVANVSAPNGTTDQDLSNDSKTVTYGLLINSFPIIEGFNADAAPSCWTTEIVTNIGGETPGITIVTSGSSPTVSPSEGSKMLKFNSYDTESGDQIRLITPPFATTGVTGAFVNFKWNLDDNYSTNTDNVQVQWSTDGTTWNNGNTYQRYNAGNTGWYNMSYALPAGALGQSKLYIGFLFTSDYGANCYMDDIQIQVDDLNSYVDASLSEISVPEEKMYCSANITPTIKVENKGNPTLTSFTVSYTIDGGTAVTQNWSGSLTTNEIATITFAAIDLTEGDHSFVANVSAPNGTTDQNPTNDSKTVAYSLSTNSFPLIEGFNADDPPSCWTTEIVTNADGETPEITIVTSGSNPTVSPSEGSKMLKFNSYDTESGDQIRLITPPFATTGVTGAFVNFKWNLDENYDTETDNVQVQWSTDGTTWNDGDTYQRYDDGNIGWYNMSYALPAGALDQSKLYVGFLFTSDYGANCYMDDIRIQTDNTSSLILQTAANNNRIKIYPNPSNGLLTISSAKSIQHMNVQIHDINGRLVYTKDYQNSTTNSIDLRDQAKGMYLIKLKIDNEIIQSKIIIE